VVTNAAGLLKEEMRRFGSLILAAADAARVPAGSALAVDREEFARQVRTGLEGQVEIRQKEITTLPEENEIAIIASGPLTSDPLAEAIAAFTGQDSLYFYDAIAPVVEADTINTAIAFRGSRYDKGDDATGDTTASTTPSWRRRRRPCTRSSAITSSRAACPSRNWLVAAATPCASGP